MDGLNTFALTADVSEAHSLVPIHERDWHLLDWQVRPSDDVYVNTEGTFGVALASYCWSWVASSLGRLSQYLAGTQANTWHMLVADVFHLEASGPAYRAALLSFIFCATCGVPLGWDSSFFTGASNWESLSRLVRPLDERIG